ncbi:MAG: cobalamin biosynthesis protein CobD [Blautia sp.]|nr:cobalamin biosynthesis protein CobD [Blautia sp.]
MEYRLTALFFGFLLDLLFGDPEGLPHPVIGIGKLIARLEERVRPGFGANEEGEKKAGMIVVVCVCAVTFLVPLIVMKLFYWKTPALGLILETIFCGWLLAANSLKKSAGRVYRALLCGPISRAREAVGMIVGRDTGNLTEEGIVKATVETVAENTSDGVIAPMFYMAIGGLPLMFLYKGINTMDSMLGYKNEKYLWFGRYAAKLDDAANFIPSRLAGVLMCAAAYLQRLDGSNAWRIFKRDRRNHASPNSAQTEAAMAGALDVELAGNASYFGKVYEKPTIGDPLREIEPEDIGRAGDLMYTTSFLMLALCLLAGSLFLTV